MEALRAIVDLRDRTLQKSRIAFGGRLLAIEQGRDIPSDGTVQKLQWWFDTMQHLEEIATDQLKEMAEGVEIVQRLDDIKGIDLILAAKVVSMIDIQRADTVSALWKYSGYGQGEYWVDANGKMAAPKQGYQWKKNNSGKKERVFVVPDPKPDWHLETRRDINIEKWCAPYNGRLKTTCYLVASSFLRCNSPYRRIYDGAREYYEANRLEWTKGHQHNAAMRKMIKVWLSHLWEVWRKIEGLPTREIYVVEKLGHMHVYTPQEFGWKEV